MPNSQKERVERALVKLDILYQDVSDPGDSDVLAAYFVETTTDRGERMSFVVTLSRGKGDVWVQGGVDAAGIAALSDEWLAGAISEFDAGLQRAPNSLFSQMKLPRFRARGFQAHASWSPRQRKIVSTVIIPSGEFSSATLGSSILLVAELNAMVVTAIAVAREKESESGESFESP